MKIRELRLDAIHDPLMDLFDARRRDIDDEIAIAATSGQLAERGAHPLMEGNGLGLQAIGRFRVAFQSDPGVEVEENGQVGHEATGRPPGKPAHLVVVELSAATLVGDRGVDEAVGDDDGTSFERGSDHLRDMLAAVRGVKQRFAARRHAGVCAVEQDLAYPRAGRGATRLEREDNVVTERIQCLGKQPRLG